MKKRKILATVSALCLSVALLVFGVYAAGTVSFNVSNTVTYTFADVLVDVNAKLFKVNSGTTNIVTKESLTTLGDDNWTEVSGGVTNGTLKSYTGSDGVYSQDDDSSTVNSSITFNMNNAFAYKVVIEFSTVSNAGVTVDYNSTAFVESTANNTSLVIKDDAENSTIVAGEKYTFIYYVLLEDATQEINTTLPTLNFTITKA